MRCSYHPAVESQGSCSVCSKPLCPECTHKIKGKVYCQDCIVQGAEWVATFKGLRLPTDAPKRAALWALIPGMGAVYNNEYLKAITYFAVFASLCIMSDNVNGVFGFGAFVFYIFTIFDSYRTAEAITRRQLEAGPNAAGSPVQDRSNAAWGIVLIILGILFLLQNIIPYHFLNRMWPLIFIMLGAYLVYRAMQDREARRKDRGESLIAPNAPERREDI
jgi:hypothetical protein